MGTIEVKLDTAYLDQAIEEMRQQLTDALRRHEDHQLPAFRKARRTRKPPHRQAPKPERRALAFGELP